MQKKGKIFVSIILFLIVGAILTFAGNIFLNYQQEINELRQQNAELQARHSEYTARFQENEQSLIILQSWIEQDGYKNANEWWTDYQNYRTGYLHCNEKVLTGQNAEYVTEEQESQLHEIAATIENSRSPAELKELSKQFNQIVEDVDKQKNEALYQEAATTEAYSWTIETQNYEIPSSGLTQQSGVNYYDGRTETYYSSNVLYHNQTSEWTVDNEGFYKTDEGYYVVAASDMDQGTTFEGSKGTCIVLDSGCNEGVTDYYVAW